MFSLDAIDLSHVMLLNVSKTVRVFIHELVAVAANILKALGHKQVELSEAQGIEDVSENDDLRERCSFAHLMKENHN